MYVSKNTDLTSSNETVNCEINVARLVEIMFKNCGSFTETKVCESLCSTTYQPKQVTLVPININIIIKNGISSLENAIAQANPTTSPCIECQTKKIKFVRKYNDHLFFDFSFLSDENYVERYKSDEKLLIL